MVTTISSCIIIKEHKCHYFIDDLVQRYLSISEKMLVMHIVSGCKFRLHVHLKRIRHHSVIALIKDIGFYLMLKFVIVENVAYVES